MKETTVEQLFSDDGVKYRQLCNRIISVWHCERFYVWSATVF